MRRRLNTATVDPHWSLRQCVDACARHGIGGIGSWRHKLGGLDLRDESKRIVDHGIAVTGMCRGGMFTAVDAAGRQAAIDIRRIRGWMEDAGDDGACEVEILSAENWWKRDPDEVLRVCRDLHQAVV